MIKALIEKAYNYIENMAVKGQNQDLAALAKQELRNALAELDKLGGSENG